MLVLRERADRTAPIEPDRATDPERVTAPRGTIVCAACLGTITNAGHRMAVGGAHEHRFMNPGGYLFHIGCFAEAVGCALVGPASDEYPWFPGFAWRIAHCGHCRVHLGWHFRSGDGSGFFGLILARLRQGDGDG
jgi:hypothetical protein